MIYTTTSSQTVIAKLYRDLKGIYSPDWISDTIEWIGEAIQEMGIDGQTQRNILQLTSENHRASLPCNIVKLNQVAGNFKNVPYGTDTFGYNNLSDSIRLEHIPLRESFMVEGDYIKTQSESISFYIDYESLPVDDNGYPMIPDHQYCLQGCTYYVIMKLIERGVQHPIFNFQAIFQLWTSYKDKAKSKLSMPDRPRMETFKRAYLRLIPNINVDPTQFYSNTGNSERFVDSDNTII